jgi:hypothetical protein
LGLIAGFVDLFLPCLVLALVVFDGFLIMSTYLFAGAYYFCVYVDVRKCYWQIEIIYRHEVWILTELSILVEKNEARRVWIYVLPEKSTSDSHGSIQAIPVLSEQRMVSRRKSKRSAGKL